MRSLAMPTVPGIPGPYRFYIYSFDCNETMHVHVRRERKVCKFWLDPIALAYNNGFSSKELNRIRKIILTYLGAFRRLGMNIAVNSEPRILALKVTKEAITSY